MRKLDANMHHRQSCTTMLVYGIRCKPEQLVNLPSEASADYHVEHNLLVFPSYTRPLTLNSNGHLTKQFWDEFNAIIHGRTWVVDREHPYITEEEFAILRAIKEISPLTTTDWFYLPESNN